MPRDVDAVVVGGGVIGLACAAALAARGRSLVLLERGAGLARETTARNSEVIHAGIYYPPGSLKARLCVAGREALYARCRNLGIPHRQLGKLIVANDDAEIATLEAFARRGAENGAPGLELVDGAEVARREPAVRARAALVSPTSGIVDGHALSLSYAAEAERHGATLVLHTEVIAIERRTLGYRVIARDADCERTQVDCGAVVNAAGLFGDRVAECAGFDVDACGYRLHLCKGDYFALAPGAPVRVSQLVYPVPHGGGLGIHATLDLAGRIRLGPDAEYVYCVDYAVDASKAAVFARAVARYLPRVTEEMLSPDYAGVRPKLAGPGEPFRDFAIEEGSHAGFPGFVNAIGIESPGLTAAPAIGEYVADLLQGL